MFTAEVLLPVGLNISKLEGQQKMASSNGSEAIDVLAYRIGSNTARFYVYSKVGGGGLDGWNSFHG